MRPHRSATAAATVSDAAATATVSSAGAATAAISGATAAPARSLRGVMPLPAA
jgi:hypothetical protein